MAFTSIELVRAHLGQARLGEVAVSDMPVTLSGTAASQLPHQGLVQGSITLKAQRAHTLFRETKSLGDEWVALTHAHLIPGSILVASDSSLGTVYAENADFVCDYAAGRIRRVDTGAIANNQSVTSWYLRYHLYSEGEDYTVNLTTGQITRRPTGLIADGQTVLTDYRVSPGLVSDDQIERAIAESGEAVLALIGAAWQEEPAPGIVIGATHWAVAQTARMRAASALANSAVASSLARAAAQIWLDLATQYETSGRTFLSRFAAPVASRQSLQRG